MAKKKIVKKKRVPKKSASKKQEVEGLYQVAIKEATQLFRNGYSEQTATEMIGNMYERLTLPNIQFVLTKASAIIASQYPKDRATIVGIHVKRYNQDYDDIVMWFEEQQYLQVPEKYRKQTQIAKLFDALDLLEAKERVLQLHTKNTQIKVYNTLNAKVKEKKAIFDLSTLSLTEKIDFLSLIVRSKKSHSEVLGVIPHGTKRENQITEDIEVEIVPPNITKIKQTNIPLPAPQPQQPEVLLTNITDKIKKALEKKAQQDFEAKGANQNQAPKLIDARSK